MLLRIFIVNFSNWLLLKWCNIKISRTIIIFNDFVGGLIWHQKSLRLLRLLVRILLGHIFALFKIFVVILIVCSQDLLLLLHKQFLPFSHLPSQFINILRVFLILLWLLKLIIIQATLSCANAKVNAYLSRAIILAVILEKIVDHSLGTSINSDLFLLFCQILMLICLLLRCIRRLYTCRHHTVAWRQFIKIGFEAWPHLLSLICDLVTIEWTLVKLIVITLSCLRSNYELGKLSLWHKWLSLAQLLSPKSLLVRFCSLKRPRSSFIGLLSRV